MFRSLITTVVLAGALAGTVYGDEPSAGAMVDPQTGASTGYYCARLGAEFQVSSFYLPEHGSFRGMRIVSPPLPGSPLDQLGLQLGDVVTRLDGVPLHNYAELNRHARHTYVRYIKTGTRTVRNAAVYIEFEPEFVSSNERP